MDRQVIGVLFGAAAGAMWASEAIIGKILFAELNFLQVTASEALFASLTALAYNELTSRERLSLTRRNIRDLLIVALIGTAVAPLMFFYGLSQTFAVNATLIAHLQPLFVSVLGAYFLNERLEKDDYMGGALILLAALLITSRTLPNLLSLRIGNFGDLMVSVATLSWAIVTVPGKKLTRETSSSVITGLRYLFSAIIFLSVLLLLDELVLISMYQILIGVLVGLGSILYYESLKRIKANRVALAELSSPFIAAVLAWYILGEVVTAMQIFGALILVTGFYMLTRDRGYVQPR